MNKKSRYSKNVKRCIREVADYAISFCVFSPSKNKIKGPGEVIKLLPDECRETLKNLKSDDISDALFMFPDVAKKVREDYEKRSAMKKERKS